MEVGQRLTEVEPEGTKSKDRWAPVELRENGVHGEPKVWRAEVESRAQRTEMEPREPLAKVEQEADPRHTIAVEE